MPELDDYLHYRMIDVVVDQGAGPAVVPAGVLQSQPEKGLAHRALADIRRASQELQYYRAHAVRAAARPDAEQARPLAASSGPPRRRRAAAHVDAATVRLTPAPVAQSGSGRMVGVAQLVEHLVVVQDVAGSSPVTHPSVDADGPLGWSARWRAERM